MASRVSFSNEHLSLDFIANYYNDMEGALRLFFSPAAPSYVARFVGWTPDQVRELLRDRLDELDRNTTLSLLASVEAAFRIDYIERNHQRKKDNVSRDFVDLYKKNGSRASLEGDIFDVWLKNCPNTKISISELRGAFRFRHWMAHGRYWTPKLGRSYDYVSVFTLVERVFNIFPLLTQ